MIAFNSTARRSPIRAAVLLFVSLMASTSRVLAQPPSARAADGAPAVGSSISADTLADLPLGENVYSILETMQSEVIADRFNNGGLNVGENARVGGFLASWSQTAFRIGDVDMTDPSGSGAPLLFPELLWWDRLTVSTGMMPSVFNPPGLGVTLVPHAPTDRWTATIRGSGSGGGLASTTPGGIVPPIARLTGLGQAAGLFSGPLVPGRLGLAAGASWQRANKLLGDVSPDAASTLGSGFVHLVYTPSPDLESRTLGWVQRTNSPFAYRSLFGPDAATRDRSVHVQSSIARRPTAGASWDASGSVTSRWRANDIDEASSLTADRLWNGPVPSIPAATGSQTAGRWSAAAHIRPEPRGTRRQHVLEAGAAVERTFANTSDAFNGRIAEMVDGAPARVWIYTHPDAAARHHATEVRGFATDRIALSPRATLDAGIDLDLVRGRATGANQGIAWASVLPRALFHWEFGNKTLVGGYRRAANRLNLDLLSFGDPNGETAIVTRLLPAPFATAAIVDRVGPGTGGNPSFSAIDSALKRPTTDEFIIGLESLRRGWLRVGLTGLARREHDLAAVEDIGVPLSSYSTIGIPDPGHDFASSADDQVLTAYNRDPSTYARNQYLLTTSSQPAATAFALKLWAEGTTDRLTVLFGATASAANGSAANRGYGPLENDQDRVGELLTDPNATTFARGRLFSDRAFTIKWTTIYHFPKDVRAGVIARYQDGQPFARLVAVPDLNQGPELIRAYPNAGNRFTFTGTLDIRIQKGLTVGTQHIDAILDFYNLATRGNEVEEYTVTGDRFRTPTATEPPRSIVLGVRFSR